MSSTDYFQTTTLSQIRFVLNEADKLAVITRLLLILILEEAHIAAGTFAEIHEELQVIDVLLISVDQQSLQNGRLDLLLYFLHQSKESRPFLCQGLRVRGNDLEEGLQLKTGYVMFLDKPEQHEIMTASSV